MGSSGAGKTTLLNILAGRVPTGTIGGQVLVNGQRRQRNWKRIIGYVEQDDVMYRTLTVRETIRYAALLRLPRAFTRKQRYARVEQVINELGLIDCADNLIGDENSRGISGGERKRTAIGIELVTNPRLLFLDEPTSGLDAFTAFNIIESIGTLVTKEVKTAIMTIHQPREDILFLFDKIILLSQGKIVFYGSVQAAMNHFSRLGYPCPRYMNPADFFLDIITVDRRSPEARQKTSQRVAMFHQAWIDLEQEIKRRSLLPDFGGPNDIPVEAIDPVLELLSDAELKDLGSDTKPQKHRPRSAVLNRNNTWLTECRILLTRNMKDQSRDLMTLFAMVVQTAVLFVLIGFTFFQLPYTQSGIQSRVGVLFFIPVNAVFSVIQPLITLFPLERAIIVRERYASTYRVSAVFVAKAISLLPFRLAITLVYGLGLYYVVGLNPGARQYFIFQGILIDSVFAAQGLGLLIGAAVPTVRVSGCMRWITP